MSRARNREGMAQIACSDCGGPAKAPNQATKYCATCRLCRGAAWHDGRETKCPTCSRTYIAWNGQKSAGTCGSCFILRAPRGGRESVRGTCGFCRQDGVLYSKHVHVCYKCLDDPKYYAHLRQQLVSVWARLKEGT